MKLLTPFKALGFLLSFQAITSLFNLFTHKTFLIPFWGFHSPRLYEALTKSNSSTLFSFTSKTPFNILLEFSTSIFHCSVECIYKHTLLDFVYCFSLHCLQSHYFTPAIFPPDPLLLTPHKKRLFQCTHCWS